MGGGRGGVLRRPWSSSPFDRLKYRLSRIRGAERMIGEYEGIGCDLQGSQMKVQYECTLYIGVTGSGNLVNGI